MDYKQFILASSSHKLTLIVDVSLGFLSFKV